MSVADLIMVIIFASVAVILVGMIGILGFVVIEPFSAAFSAPAGLGWGSPGDRAVTFASFGFVGMLLTIILFFVAYPIRNDRRQDVRR